MPEGLVMKYASIPGGDIVAYIVTGNGPPLLFMPRGGIIDPNPFLHRPISRGLIEGLTARRR